MTFVTTLSLRRFARTTLTLLLAAGSLTGCVEIAGDATLLPDAGLNLGGRGDAGGPSTGGGINDGTSSTIQPGEQNGGSPGTSPARDDVPDEGDVTPPPPAPGAGEDTPPADQPPADDSTPPPPPQDNLAQQFQTALGNTFIEFGNSSFFSSGSITDSIQLQLCAFGRFGMLVTTVTSTQFDTFSSERTMLGTWLVQSEGNRLLLVLNVDQATDQSDIGTQKLELSTDANGRLLIDGASTTVSDATADCNAAQQQP